MADGNRQKRVKIQELNKTNDSNNQIEIEQTMSHLNRNKQQQVQNSKL